MYLKKKSVAPLQYSNACNITEICVAMHIMVVVKHMFSTVHNAALSCDKSKTLYKTYGSAGTLHQCRTTGVCLAPLHQLCTVLHCAPH